MLKELIKKLSQIMPLSQASLEAEILLEFVSGLKKKDFFINPNLELSEEQTQKLNALLKRRLEERIAIQCLIKKSWFMGETFFVSDKVLIPRPETELLVEKTIEKAKNLKTPKVLDIGTGSGAIAIMLKKNLDCEVMAADISTDALEVAKINAENLKAEIKFVHSDLFSQVKDKFDIIVSNPPYIPISQKQTLEPEVLNEPASALFTQDKDGIEVYQKIITQAVDFLTPDGWLLFEAGMGQSGLLRDLLKKNGFKNIQTFCDLSSIERVVCAQFSYNI